MLLIEGSIGHFSTRMLIKIHFNQNTFTSLEISNLTIFDPPKNVLKVVGKVKVIKAPVGIKLIC